MSRLDIAAADLVKNCANVVLLRHDFDDKLEASYPQITRIIRRLIANGELLRIGLGMYAKTRRSRRTGEVMPVTSVTQLAREALARLNFTVVPTSAERAYNERHSTQVPTGRVIGVRENVTRRIGYNDVDIKYERVRA